MTTQRSACWSLTINNPTPGDVNCVLPGWKLEGQYEEGEEGTRHFQGMLKTPQVRFSQVKKAFPRAHIEVARNATALGQYVHKDETRVGVFEGAQTPNIFQLQSDVVMQWDIDEWTKLIDTVPEEKHGDIALSYTDTIVSRMIEKGVTGIEFTAVNPMWRSSWKRFWKSIVARPLASFEPETDRQTDTKETSDEEAERGRQELRDARNPWGEPGYF